MTQEELKNALLDALLEYETLKKTRRLKALKKALRGTVMATVIGSAGFTGANSDRANPLRETPKVEFSNPVDIAKQPSTSQEFFIKGVAHFELNRFTLTPEYEAWLSEISKQFPKGTEVSVIGRADGHGIPLHNKKLGRLRAIAVANFLVDHGIKIKAIHCKVSKNAPIGWMERRVDLIVNSAPLLAKTTSKPSDIQQASKQRPNLQAPQKALSTIDYHDALLQTLQENENQTLLRKYKNSEPKPAYSDTKTKPDRLVKQRLKVSGVTHFALNRHTLTSTHKERLLDLIKQLPKDAELTVIGRTDSVGNDDFNKTLGMQRAKTVAIFLANQGVKVKAVASKVSSDKYAGWMARRVDIIVDSDSAHQPISLPPPVVQESKVRSEFEAQFISSIQHKKPRAIERDVSSIIQHARYRFNTNESGDAFTETAQRWYGLGKGFNAR
ncbi:MAG: OmpA family protein [Methylococcaceae bacterium]|nr:OmpA family protein [Methylococcaceae bacterium]